MMKKIIFIIILCFLGTVLGIGICEFLLRLFGYYRCSLNQAFPSMYVESPRYNHELRKNIQVCNCSYYGDYNVVYTIDSNGDRMVPNNSIDNSPTRPIVLLLGDSFTFGIGVDDGETFAAQLSNMYGTEKTIAVINKGVPGYTIDQELLVLKDFFREHNNLQEKICAIVLQVTLGNDLLELNQHVTNLDAETIHDQVMQVDDTFKLNAKSKHQNILKRFARNLFLYRFLIEDYSYHKQIFKKWLGLVPPSQNTLSIEEDPQWVKQNRALIERYIQIADKFFEIIKDYNFPVIVLFESRVANRELCSVIKQYFKTKSHVKLIDISQYLDKNFYLKGDPHFNAQGHMEIARLLASMIHCDKTKLDED